MDEYLCFLDDSDTFTQQQDSPPIVSIAVGSSRGLWCLNDYMIVSFDLINKEFEVVDVPDSITNRFLFGFSISKLRESLIVFGYVRDYEMFTDDYCGVSMMVRAENGEPIIVAQKEDEQFPTLEVYEPHSRQITNLGIFGADGLFFMSSCTESMLLLDHPDSCIYLNALVMYGEDVSSVTSVTVITSKFRPQFCNFLDISGLYDLKSQQFGSNLVTDNALIFFI
nr:hypothetical protein [Tanacetum cinerariifolium]